MNSKRRLASWLGLAALLGVSVGGILHSFKRPAAAVVLEPEFVEIARDPLEGETVSTTLMLRNLGATSVSVVSATSSCGCMELVTKGGAALSRPIELDPGGSIPWQVTISTQARIGQQKELVSVRSVAGADEIESVAAIHMNVRAAWRAEPPMVTLRNSRPGVQVDTEAFILDSYPDPGIEYREVHNSAPNRFKVAVEPFRDSAGGESVAEVTYAGTRLKRRYRVRISYVPPASEEVIEDWISVSPKVERQASLRIPIICCPPPPEYRFDPPSLTFVTSASQRTVVRTVYCYVRAGADPALVVLGAPESTDLRLREVDAATKAIEVRWRGAGAGVAGDGIRFGVKRGGKVEEVYRLPVVFLDSNGMK